MARNPLGEQIADRGKAVIIEWQERNPDKILDLSHAQLSVCDLSGIDFSRANLEHANLSFCNLEDCVFDGATMVSTNLSAARLSGAIFRTANLQGAKLRHAVVGRFNHVPDLASNSLVVESAKAASFERCNLRETVFHAAMLCGVIFEDCHLGEADFFEAVLEAAEFVDCELVKTRFGLSQMVCTKLIRGVVRQADFAKANLFYTVFRQIEELSAVVTTATFSRESLDEFLACQRSRTVRTLEQGRGGPTFIIDSPGKVQAEATGTHGSTVVKLPPQPMSSQAGLTYGGSSRPPGQPAD